tara:strand:+ start:312 stop:674 length:363 start_codon:yes stop_codon:yes gene_type:complete
MKVINIIEKFDKFSGFWKPKVIAEMNDYQFKIVKIKGDFTPHKHIETDEVFIVIEGIMYIEFSNKTVKINSGEMIVVPKGIQHKPFSKDECKIMLIEPIGVLNTGNSNDKELTAPNNKWV